MSENNIPKPSAVFGKKKPAPDIQKEAPQNPVKKSFRKNDAPKNEHLTHRPFANSLKEMASNRKGKS